MGIEQDTLLIDMRFKSGSNFFCDDDNLKIVFKQFA